MSVKSADFWGTAVGFDKTWAKRRIRVFKNSRGFDFVDENLDSRSSATTSVDSVVREIAMIFGLRDVKLELPHLGIYSSSKTSLSNAAAARPVRAPMEDAWGSILKQRKPRG